MEDIDIALVKKRSLTGIVALTSRTFVIQILAFVATFLLTIFLSPSVFGVFYVVSAIIAFLGYFSDIGLAAALVQKKEDVTAQDLTTTFTIQQMLVGIVVVIALYASSWIATFYRLDTAGLWLFRALVVSFFLSSLKTIPSVLLERKLDFRTLVIPQLLETVGFYGVAVLLAWRGWGIASFTWAVMVRAVVGLIAIYMLSPWRISVGFSRPVARRLLRFGIPFQLNSFLALLKDDLLTVFLGKILPFAQVGYIGWAKKWAEVPLRLIMDSVVRVTFPAFSRIQQSKKILGQALEQTLFGLSATIIPVTIGLLFAIRPILTIVPRYSKWEPALFSFTLFAVASIIAGLTTPLTNALNAIGRIKTTLVLMVMWTVATWVLTVTLIHYYGFNGVSIALLTITATIVLVVFLVKQSAPFLFIKSIRGPVVASAVQGIWYIAVTPWGITSTLRLILAGSAGVILYLIVIFFLEKERIGKLVGYVRKEFSWRK